MSITLSSGFADGKWPEIQAGYLASISYALTRMAAVREIEAEEGFQGKDFGDRLETKTLRLMAEIARHAMTPKG